MKVYENVVIGNFLYGLGVSVGKLVKGDDFPSVINLIQQTPDDVPLGDLLYLSEGMLIIAEFKLAQNTRGQEKERNKQKKLEEQLKIQPDLIHVSREVHWYIEADTSTGFLETEITPYIDAFKTEKNYSRMSEFLKRTADLAVNGGAVSTAKQMNKYIAMLATVHGKEGSGSNGIKSAGIFAKISTDGSITYMQTESIYELVMTMEKIREERERGSGMEQDVGKMTSLEYSNERSNKRDIDHGPY